MLFFSCTYIYILTDSGIKFKYAHVLCWFMCWLVHRNLHLTSNQPNRARECNVFFFYNRFTTGLNPSRCPNSSQQEVWLNRQAEVKRCYSEEHTQLSAVHLLYAVYLMCGFRTLRFPLCVTSGSSCKFWCFQSVVTPLMKSGGGGGCVCCLVLFMSEL